MKIAVYAIALNEAKHVERWVAATKDADVRVVCDTGSTDGTAELLEAAGVIVHRISVNPWRFDVARNAALSLVPADVDVCLSLDLDEVPNPNFFKKVRKQWRPDTNKGNHWLNTGSSWLADRLHSRKGWRWVSPCHEVTEWYGDGIPNVVMVDAEIRHLPDDSKSRGQYLPLLEMAAKETPHDPRMWVYLCREYYYHSMWQRVIDTANEAMNRDPWPPEAAAVCRWAAQACTHLGRSSEATEWYRTGVEKNPHEGEPWFGVAIDAYHRQAWDECLDASIQIIEMPRTQHYLYDRNIWDWQAFDLAAVSAFNLGFLHEALTFARQAAAGGGPEHERIVRNLKLLEETYEQASS